MRIEETQRWISEVRLRNFRGIIGPLGLKIPRPGKSGSVLFILGDNASGKSSVCDAIEFVTRGVVSRRLQGGEKSRREIKNLSTAKAPPSVWLETSNGDQAFRGAPRDRDWTWPRGATQLKPGDVVSGFDKAPVVIRREAVESFWRIPETSRLDYFWDYLKRPDQQTRTAADEQLISEGAAAVRATRRAKRAVLKIFPSSAWPAGFALPTHSDVAYSALTKNFRKARRRKNLTKEEAAAFKAYVHSLAEEERLRHDVASAKKKAPRDTRQLRELLASIGPRVTTDFFAIYGEDWITDILFEVGKDRSLRVLLHRGHGQPLRPEEVLSEAGLDVLSLVIAVELHIAAASLGQAKLLVFDDVFQSVDSVFRKRIVDHFARALQGWQLIFTLHDRAWLEIAERAFADRKYDRSTVVFRRGGYGRTPTVMSTRTGPLRDLETAIDAGSSPVTLAALAGRTLEALAERLSVFLSVSVQRQEGDRYEMRHLWPGVKEKIDASAEPTAKALVDTMDYSTFLRNRVGAHANDWADGLSETEALEAAQRVMDLWRVFLCSTCGQFGKKKTLENGKWKMTFGCCTPPSGSDGHASTLTNAAA